MVLEPGVYSGYCIVNTIEKADKLLVYVSTHSPPEHYAHLSRWFGGVRPEKDGLLLTIPLPRYDPEVCVEIVSFFSAKVSETLLANF